MPPPSPCLYYPVPNLKPDCQQEMGGGRTTDGRFRDEEFMKRRVDMKREGEKEEGEISRPGGWRE